VYARTGKTNRWSNLMQYVIFNQIQETLLNGSWRLPEPSDLWVRGKLCGDTWGQTIDGVHFEWPKGECDSWSCYRRFVGKINVRAAGKFFRNVVCVCVCGGVGSQRKDMPQCDAAPCRTAVFRRTVALILRDKLPSEDGHQGLRLSTSNLSVRH